MACSRSTGLLLRRLGARPPAPTVAPPLVGTPELGAEMSGEFRVLSSAATLEWILTTDGLDPAVAVWLVGRDSRWLWLPLGPNAAHLTPGRTWTVTVSAGTFTITVCLSRRTDAVPGTALLEAVEVAPLTDFRQASTVPPLTGEAREAQEATVSVLHKVRPYTSDPVRRGTASPGSAGPALPGPSVPQVLVPPPPASLPTGSSAASSPSSSSSSSSSTQSPAAKTAKARTPSKKQQAALAKAALLVTAEVAGMSKFLNSGAGAVGTNVPPHVLRAAGTGPALTNLAMDCATIHCDNNTSLNITQPAATANRNTSSPAKGRSTNTTTTTGATSGPPSDPPVGLDEIPAGFALINGIKVELEPSTTQPAATAPTKVPKRCANFCICGHGPDGLNDLCCYPLCNDCIVDSRWAACSCPTGMAARMLKRKAPDDAGPPNKTAKAVASSSSAAPPDSPAPSQRELRPRRQPGRPLADRLCPCCHDGDVTPAGLGATEKPCVSDGCDYFVCANRMHALVRRMPNLEMLLHLNGDYRCCDACFQLLLVADIKRNKAQDKIASIMAATKANPLLDGSTPLMRADDSTDVQDDADDITMQVELDAAALQDSPSVAEHQMLLSATSRSNIAEIQHLQKMLQAKLEEHAAGGSAAPELTSILNTAVASAISSAPVTTTLGKGRGGRNRGRTGGRARGAKNANAVSSAGGSRTNTATATSGATMSSSASASATVKARSTATRTKPPPKPQVTATTRQSTAPSGPSATPGLSAATAVSFDAPPSRPPRSMQDWHMQVAVTQTTPLASSQTQPLPVASFPANPVTLAPPASTHRPVAQAPLVLPSPVTDGKGLASRV